MRYGHFSADGMEYIVSTPATPRPWMNRFGNSDHAVIISHTAGGYAIAGDAHRFQMNWYVPRYDEAGRYLYLRDDRSGEYWGGSFAPVRKPLDRFECRHGQAWSTFVSEQNGIACEYTVFVPIEGPVELWNVKVTNRSRRARRVTVMPFMEWSLDDGPQSVDDLVYAAHTDGGFDRKAQAVWASTRQTARFRFFRAFMMADVPIDGWQTNRAAFVGEGRTLANPREVESGRLGGLPCESELCIGVLAKKLRLAPGAAAAFTVMAGMVQTSEERVALRRKFLGKGRPQAELARLREFWAGMTNRFSIRTPDADLDRYVNRCLVAHTYTQGSTNAVRPIRIQLRNQMQDALGMAILAPDYARRIVCRLMNFHCASGDALNYMSYGAEWPQKPDHVDTKVWVVYSTAAYIRHTGDYGILDFRARFYDADQEIGLRDLLVLVLDKCWRDRGPHGLSLIGRGDWNDSLDGMGCGGRGESIWMSEAVHLALVEAAGLFERLGERKRAGEFRARARRLCAAINRWGWDGNWYLMGYNDEGRKVGSHRAKQGRLFLMPQAWAVLSGVASPARQKKLFRAVETLLKTRFGYTLMEKPITTIDKGIGSLTFLQQGLNENGAIYVHSNAFLMCAFGLAGRGDALYDGLCRQFPNFLDPAVTRHEPFVLGNYYRPPAIPRKFGVTHRSWVTTAPSWFMLAIGEGLFGVRAGYDGIEIRPSFPKRWKRASIRREIRGATYDVEIINAGQRGGGVRRLTLDGATVRGTVIPYQPAGSTHEITVTLG